MNIHHGYDITSCSISSYSLSADFYNFSAPLFCAIMADIFSISCFGFTTHVKIVLSPFDFAQGKLRRRIGFVPLGINWVCF